MFHHILYLDNSADSTLLRAVYGKTVTSSASDIHVSGKLFKISSSLACSCAASLKKSPKMNQISINANDESMISISANTLYIRCTYAQINVI